MVGLLELLTITLQMVCPADGLPCGRLALWTEVSQLLLRSALKRTLIERYVNMLQHVSYNNICLVLTDSILTHYSAFWRLGA
jgi:hypothetical protein